MGARIIFVLDYEPNHIAGPLNSVTCLAVALTKSRDVLVVNMNPRWVNQRINGIEIFRADQITPRPGDSLVFDGIFHVRYLRYMVFALLWRRRIDLVFSPRSNLMRSGLQRSSLKKSLFLSVFFPLSRLCRARFHFLSAAEKRNSIPVSGRYFIVPNGVRVSAKSVTSSIDNKRIIDILFIGRLDVVHKGLDLLIDFLALNKEKIIKENYRCKILGPGPEVIRINLRAMIERYDLSSYVEVGSEVLGSEKEKMMRSARIFVHLSRFEGQPQAVLEAIFLGCFPLISSGTNLNYMPFGVPSYSVKELSELRLENVEHTAKRSDLEGLRRNLRATQAWDVVAREFERNF